MRLRQYSKSGITDHDKTPNRFDWRYFGWSWIFTNMSKEDWTPLQPIHAKKINVLDISSNVNHLYTGFYRYLGLLNIPTRCLDLRIPGATRGHFRVGQFRMNYQFEILSVLLNPFHTTESSGAAPSWILAWPGYAFIHHKISGTVLQRKVRKKIEPVQYPFLDRHNSGENGIGSP